MWLTCLFSSFVLAWFLSHFPLLFQHHHRQTASKETICSGSPTLCENKEDIELEWSAVKRTGMGDEKEDTNDDEDESERGVNNSRLDI